MAVERKRTPRLDRSANIEPSQPLVSRWVDIVQIGLSSIIERKHEPVVTPGGVVMVVMAIVLTLGTIDDKPGKLALLTRLRWHPPCVSGEFVLAMHYRFVFEDEANAFFTTAENFAQLQISEPSSQRVGFDRSIDRFAAEEDWFLGINIIGGPTG